MPRNVGKLVQVSAAPRYEVRRLDVDEARQLLDAAREDRLYALRAVALGVSLRREGALGMLWENIDLDAGTLRRADVAAHSVGFGVRPPKGERSQRTVPLPLICVTALKDHRLQHLEERLVAGPPGTKWDSLDYLDRHTDRTA